MPGQPPEPGKGSGINPNYPGTNPAGGSDPNLVGQKSNGDQLSDQSGFSDISDDKQMDMLNLQDAMNKQAQLMQMMSNIQKMMNDTIMAIIRNLK